MARASTRPGQDHGRGAPIDRIKRSWRKAAEEPGVGARPVG